MKRTMLALVLLGCMVAAGCQQRFQMDTEVFDRFDLVTLKVSKSADVLHALKKDDEMIAQSPTVVVSWGQRNEQDHLWCNVVAFDDQTLAAARKYAAAFEEFDRVVYITARRKLRFDAQLVVPRQLLDEPYADAGARNRAVLAWAIDTFKHDMDSLGDENTELAGLVMLVRQTGNGIIQTLDRSPGLAENLPDTAGVAFDQINLGTGCVRLLVRDDVARIKIKVGKEWFDGKPFEKHPDVQNM